MGRVVDSIGRAFSIAGDRDIGRVGRSLLDACVHCGGRRLFVHFSNRSAGALVGGDPWLHIAGSGRHDLLRPVWAADVGRGQRRPLFGVDRPWLSGGLHHQSAPVVGDHSWRRPRFSGGRGCVGRHAHRSSESGQRAFCRAGRDLWRVGVNVRLPESEFAVGVHSRSHFAAHGVGGGDAVCGRVGLGVASGVDCRGRVSDSTALGSLLRSARGRRETDRRGGRVDGARSRR